MAAADLDPEVRRDLLSLEKLTADRVGRHLVMVTRMLDDDPALALEHARAARRRASRVGVVRETAGIAAYNAGEWQEAVSELRAARRITGNAALLPLIADAERGLGRPERAIEIARSDDGRALSGDDSAEMTIVEAGARIDLGEPQKALVTLQRQNLKPGQTGTVPARLYYAYASALLAAGRRDDAVTWYMNAAAADVEDVTDAELRLVELTDGDAVESGADDYAGGSDAGDVDTDAVEAVAATDDGLSDEGVTETAVAVEVPDSDGPAATTEDTEPTSEDDSAVASPVVANHAPASADPQAPATEEPTQETDERDAAANRAFGDVYDALLLDLDGTVFAGHRALPGAIETLAKLPTPRYFVTNNASRRPAEVAAHLIDLGFDAEAEQVITSAQTAARLLSEHLEPGSRALVVGTDGLAQEVREVGIGVTRSADDRPAAVIQGHSTDTGWAQLSEAALAVRAGALWIACNIDATFPSERGMMIGNGSMVAAVANATGKTPLVAGKPAAPLMADAIARSRAQNPLVVGDRLDTDIEGAHAVGIDSLMVLTGVNNARDLLAASPQQRPTFVVENLTGLLHDPDAVRIADHDGWNVEVGASTATVTRSTVAAATESLLPALAAAVWRAGDHDDIDSTQIVVSSSDENVSDLLTALGLGSMD